MKTTAFGGHYIFSEDSELQKIQENKLFEDYSQGVKESIEAKFKRIGISEFEQIYFMNESARDFLYKYLEITADEYDKLLKYAENQIGDDNLLNLKQSFVLNKGLGAIEPPAHLLTESRQIDKIKPIPDKTNTNYIYNAIIAKSKIETNLTSLSNYVNGMCSFSQLIPIQNQGTRGTCVAFSVTSANEYYHFKFAKALYKLSEQHLYFESKQIDGNDSCGTSIASAIEIISNKGQCRSNFWIYRPTTDCNEHGQKPILADLDSSRFKATCLQLNSSDIMIIKACIVSDGFVCFSIPVFNSWYLSKEVNRTGRITMPIPNETNIGGHAMTIIGFQDDINYPGGGFFIFRNSWGENWGKHSPYGKGLGIIPYEYIRSYCWELFTLVC